MLTEDKTFGKKYKAIDPFMKQSPIQDYSNPVQYEESVREEINQYGVYDYARYDTDHFRDKRHGKDHPKEPNIEPTTMTWLRSLRDKSLEDPYRGDDYSGGKGGSGGNVGDGRKGGNETGTEIQEKFLTPLYAITGFFAFLIILGPLFVRRGPNRGIVQGSIILSGFCMWLFWFVIYFGTMNPLIGPRLENTTVVWMAYKLVYFIFFSTDFKKVEVLMSFVKNQQGKSLNSTDVKNI